MKFLKKLGVILFTVTTLVACGSGLDRSKPEEVAKAVVQSLADNDAKTFKELFYVPEDIPKNVDINGKIAVIFDMTHTEYKTRFGDIKEIKVVSVEEAGNFVFVTVDIIGSTGEKRDRMRLRQKDAQWFFDPN